MIYVTQGHESGIGLEIFLKSFLLLSKPQKKIIALVVDPTVLEKNLKDLNLDQNLFVDLNVINNKKYTPYHSSNSLLTTLELLTPTDILVTLPTSKDQLVFQNKIRAGYTEFFRAYFKNDNISMLFHGLDKNILLITDHAPLKAIPTLVSKDLIFNKISISLNNFKTYFKPIDQVIIAGINPHAGENGLLGNEEAAITNALDELRANFTQEFLGPLSGDTLHVYEDKNKSQLFVYMFHDQGLASFKSEYGWVGLNISLGLPFLRLSVDHGTAFSLYGKNKANITGMMYLLKKALEVHRVH